MSTLRVEDGPKMLQETFCLAQYLVNAHRSSRRAEHSDRLQRLIDECERMRPTGPGGKHGDLHTPECGCDDVAPSVPVGGLPDGTVVDVTMRGRIATGSYGSRPRLVEFERGNGHLNFLLSDCSSVEPVPVVPEPGRWYADGTGSVWWAFAGPAGDTWLMCWDDPSFTLSWKEAQTNDYAIKLPLVECEPPAEFRDGQQ